MRFTIIHPSNPIIQSSNQHHQQLPLTSKCVPQHTTTQTHHECATYKHEIRFNITSTQSTARSCTPAHKHHQNDLHLQKHGTDKVVMSMMSAPWLFGCLVVWLFGCLVVWLWLADGIVDMDCLHNEIFTHGMALAQVSYQENLDTNWLTLPRVFARDHLTLQVWFFIACS